MTGTPGGCSEAALNLMARSVLPRTTVAASRSGKGRKMAFDKKLLGERAVMSVSHVVLEKKQDGKPCEETKPLLNAHIGFIDELNSNAAIGDAQKENHSYIHLNVVKNLLPSSTERHGKYGLLMHTSGNLVRMVVMANDVPITN
eukprot:1332609-Prymnesium_polylepis.1